MATDTQPEEAASRAPAAAAGFAGSLAQTKVYGRGAQMRAAASATRQADRQHATEQDRPQTNAGTPDPAGQQAPEANLGAELTERAVGRLDRSLDDPAADAELRSDGPAGEGTALLDAAEPGGTATAEPVVPGEMIVAASAHDATEAQARMARSLLPEPLPIAPPAPGLGPAL